MRERRSGTIRQSSSRQKTLNSYYRGPALIDTEKSPDKTVSRISKRRLGWLVIGLIGALLLYSTWLDPSRLDMKIDQAAYRSSSAYQQAVQNELKRLPNRTFLTLNEQEVELRMKERFVEIDSISITAQPLSRAVNVKITTFQPQFILESKSGLYIVDSQGRAVVKISQQQADVSRLVRVQDATGFEISLRKAVLSTEELTFITMLIKGLQSNGMAISRLELPPIARQLRLYQPSVSYYVKFHTGGDSQLQLGALKALEQELQKEGKQPAEYIDVRVEGKVFYK